MKPILTAFCLLISLSNFASNNTPSTAKIATAFVGAINSHKLDDIKALMTDDHVFLDAIGNHLNGKENMGAAWNGYFTWFGDYSIEIEQLMVKGDTAFISGFASGTFNTAKGDSNAHWRLPAAWRVVVKQGKVSLWQVYADTKIPFEIIKKYSKEADTPFQEVQGFGGVFIKSDKPKELAAWYDKHFGTSFGKMGFSVFWWRDFIDQNPATTTFGIFKASSNYFEPSGKPFMLNFRVRNLDATLKRLKDEGVTVMDKTETYDYGKFGWIIDADSNKVELWQPVNEEEQFGGK